MVDTRDDREAFRWLLREYDERPERRERIVAEIEGRFRRSRAIVVVDSSRFSRAVQERGVVHCLALLDRLGRLIEPAVGRHGGRLLKIAADNFYATFPDAPAAVAYACELRRVVEAANEPLSAADRISIAVGIGYGEVLAIGAEDLYGDEMNLACKLGEDLARRDEILLTESAYRALSDSPPECQPALYTVSGLELTAYRLI